MSGPTTKLRQGDVVAKKYEVDSLIGEGPTGASYKARVMASGKMVCIKVLNGPPTPIPTATAMVQRIQSAKADALVALTDVGEHAGSLYVVSEHFEAESLRRLMDTYAGQRKSFSLQEACQIVVRALEAIESAHHAGLVHRHVKPGNILIQTTTVGPGKVVRTVKLVGLGVSELINPGTLAENMLESGDNRYMAPELTSPSAGGTVQTDLYSVGVIFYELLTGQTPMGTYLSPTQVREDLPNHVDDIVDIAIAAEAADRYPSARDMINDISRAFTDDDKPTATLPRKTIGMVVGGSVLVLGLIGGYFAMNDPAATAKKEDDSQRARIIRENPIDAGAMEAKVAGHPNMVYVPTGTLLRGRMRTENSSVAAATEPLATEKKVPGYYMDMFEYPNEVGGHATVNATRADATAGCATRGKRLCTALEWERACKGPEMTVYGYGNAFKAEACGTDPGGDKDQDGGLDRASGSQEGCKSGWGVYDLSGGALEWTADSASNTKFGVLKGGKRESAAQGTRCAYSLEFNATATNRAIGFRCCMSDDGSLPIDPNALPAVPVEGAPVVPAPAVP